MKHDTRWTVRKITARLALIAPMVYRHKHPMPPFKYMPQESPSAKPLIGADVDDSGWETIEPGSYWGSWYTDYTMRTEFEVPAGWDDDATVALYLPLGDSGDFSHPESLAYIDGEGYASCDRHHHEIVLPAKWCDGKKHRLALVGWTGLGGFGSGEPRSKLFMKDCAVVQIDQTTRDFVAGVRVALGVVEELHDNDPIRSRLLNALNDAFNVVDTRTPLGEDFYATVGDALETLQEGIKMAGAPMDVDVIAAGHAHIDVAWLWTLAQTRRKCARTFSNVLRLMERYPDYCFTQSQPQLYQYVKEDYPEIFEDIKKRVKEGRWELIGGSWVEQDCNASGAESLARQFVLGRRFFRENFGEGVETRSFWLPDTFGYPWALPQLMKLAGLKYFITHKMSWNQYNRMPYQSFWWKGIDGSEILTHFMTTRDKGSAEWGLPYATTYNGDVSPYQIMDTWVNYLHKETHSELFTAFGHGDGGGGPTEEMIENAIQMKDHPGMPRVRFGTIRDFLEKLENESGEKLPDWHGELYFEYHRGTYTSQARNKRKNRKNEYLMQNAEFLAALAAVTGDYDYPQEDINQAWELICLNQFHDILPGSSIGPVYEDSAKDYATIKALGEKVRDSALEALAAQLPAEAELAVVNPTSFEGQLVGLLPEQLADGKSIVDVASGESLATQVVEAGTLVQLPDAKAYQLRGLSVNNAPAKAKATALSIQTGDRTVMENDLLRVEFNNDGDIVRIFDKAAGREVMPEGERANVFQMFEDRPMNFEAWDIDIFYDDRQWEAEAAHEISVIEEGPLRVGLLIKRNLRSSQIVQRVYLYHDSPRLDFDTWIDWHEHEILLKVAFPVNVFSPTATYDIQWGNIERPTHQNTSWDWARFEVNAYHWADLSEGNYGVSLLNDCKYGYDIRNNVMRLTLLKSATMPDPNADQGEHLVTYSLFPHQGDWRSGTVAEGYTLNNPLIIRTIKGQGDGAALAKPFVSVDKSNVIIETVKQAEDGDGVIVRLYENERNRGKVSLKVGFPVKTAYICNLLEDNETELTVDDDAVTLDITPYQIITVRLVPA